MKWISLRCTIAHYFKMAGAMACVFVNVDNMWSFIIPFFEALLAFVMFQISLVCIISYNISYTCHLASMFKIPVVVHLIFMLLEILNTWYFKSSSMLAFSHAESKNVSSTSYLMELDNHEDQWWRVYVKHYIITTWKIVDFIVEVTFLIMYINCSFIPL